MKPLSIATLILVSATSALATNSSTEQSFKLVNSRTSQCLKGPSSFDPNSLANGIQLGSCDEAGTNWKTNKFNQLRLLDHTDAVIGCAEEINGILVLKACMNIPLPPQTAHFKQMYSATNGSLDAHVEQPAMLRWYSQRSGCVNRVSGTLRVDQSCTNTSADLWSVRYNTAAPPPATPAPTPAPTEPAPIQPTERTVSLLGAHGRYLVAENGGGLDANRTGVGPWEQFRMTDRNGGKLVVGDQVHFFTAHQRYVVAEANGQALANRTQPGPWEIWTIEVSGKPAGSEIKSGDPVGFKSHHGSYLVAEPNGQANANRAALGPWETWKLTVY